MKNFCLAALFFLSIFSTGLCAANAEEKTLKPIVVTATRMETPAEEVTTSITVVTSEEIRRQQAETVLEALRTVPGLDVVQSGSRGSTTSVFIRGSNSNQVLVMIDGMEINSVTAGNFNFAHLPTDNVERIEVMRGSGGTLYGSKAVGGVINIITRRGKGTPRLSLDFSGGNGRTHRQSVGLAGGTERWSYSLTGSFLNTEGFRSVNDDYRKLSTSSYVGFHPTPETSLTSSFWLTETKLGLFNSNNSSSVPDPNDRQEDQMLVGQLGWNHEPSETWGYNVRAGLTHGHERNVTRADAIDTENKATRIRPQILSPQFQAFYRWHEISDLIFGFDWDIRKAKFEGIRRKQNNQAVYLQNHFHFFNNKLLVVGGVRWDHNEDFGQEWSPSGSLAYRLPETGTTLRASYAQSFRAPTFNDLFFPGFSNPELDPEKAWEFNLGLEQKLWSERIAIETIFFHREVKELIEFSGLSPENIGKANFDGVEVILRTRLPLGLSFEGNYTFLNSSQRITRRPKHKGGLTLNYENGPLNFNLRALMIGQRLDVDAVTFAKKDKAGYGRLDLAASYRLPWKPLWIKEASLYGEIENLLDKKYEEADGFRARPLNFLIGLRGVFGRK